MKALTVEERAALIADEANECCVRSDGYREDIYELALRHLREACDAARDALVTP